MSLQDIRSALSESALADSAHRFHRSVQSSLESRGWKCQREVYVLNRGDGRSGRIDLMAERDGTRIAIEMDRQTPRRKSLVKLRGVPADVRVCLLRSSIDDYQSDGVHVIGANLRARR